MRKASKFDKLERDDLLKLCLQQEDELEKLRPVPAKFKLGQLVARVGKHPYWPGQPACYFVVLSVENSKGEWFYGYGKHGQHNFLTWPEKQLRAVTQADIDGSGIEGQELAAEQIVGGLATAIANGNTEANIGYAILETEPEEF